MDVLEDMMSESGKIVYEERSAFVSEFLPIFLDLYQKLSGNDGGCKICEPWR